MNVESLPAHKSPIEKMSEAVAGQVHRHWRPLLGTLLIATGGLVIPAIAERVTPITAIEANRQLAPAQKKMGIAEFIEVTTFAAGVIVIGKSIDRALAERFPNSVEPMDYQ